MIKTRRVLFLIRPKSSSSFPFSIHIYFFIILCSGFTSYISASAFHYIPSSTFRKQQPFQPQQQNQGPDDLRFRQQDFQRQQQQYKQAQQIEGIPNSHHPNHSAFTKLAEDLQKDYLTKSLFNSPSSINFHPMGTTDQQNRRRQDLATRPREARRGIVEDWDLNLDLRAKPPAHPFLTSNSNNNNKSSFQKDSSTFIGSQYQPESGKNGQPDKNDWIGLLGPTTQPTNSTHNLHKKMNFSAKSKNYADLSKQASHNPYKNDIKKNFNTKHKSSSNNLRSNNTSLNSITKVKASSKNNKLPKIGINTSSSHVTISKRIVNKTKSNSTVNTVSRISAYKNATAKLNALTKSSKINELIANITLSKNFVKNPMVSQNFTISIQNNPKKFNPVSSNISSNSSQATTKSFSTLSIGNTSFSKTFSEKPSFFKNHSYHPTEIKNTFKSFESKPSINRQQVPSPLPINVPSINPFLNLNYNEMYNASTSLMAIHNQNGQNQLNQWNQAQQNKLIVQPTSQTIFNNDFQDNKIEPTITTNQYMPINQYQNHHQNIQFRNPYRFIRRPLEFNHGTGRMISSKHRYFNFNEQDDSDEVKDKHEHPIVDPQHPLVINALNPLGNPAREPDQHIQKKAKILDPSSLIPLNKTYVYVALMLSWVLFFTALCSYKALSKKGGLAAEKLGHKPLLFNIPQDGTNPFFTARALDTTAGSRWNFTKVLEYIEIAQKTYEGFDWQNMDCQKRVLCELAQKDNWAGETGRQLTNNYFLTFATALEGIPIPRLIQAYLEQFKEAVTQGKNSTKNCGDVYKKCKFSIKEVIASAGKKKPNTL